MKKLILFTFASFLISGFANAQFYQSGSLQDFYNEYRIQKYKEGLVNPYAEIQGTPYESKDFAKGSVVTRSGLKYDGISMRYNIYADEIEFTSPDSAVMNLGAPEMFEFIMIGDAKYIYSPYASGQRILRGYFKVITEGKATLLLKKNITLKEAQPPAAYKDAEPARFINNTDDYYIRIEQAEARRISGKKDLPSIFEAQSTAIEAYASKSKTRYNRAADLSELVSYYNQMK